MKTFSPSEAAFEGFRLIRRKPGAVAIWGLLNLVLGALVLGLVVLVIAPEAPTVLTQIAAAKAAAGGGTPDSSWAVPLIMKLRALQLMVQPIGLVFLVVMTCAIYRAVQRSGENGYGYLKLGGDELRLVALYLVFFVIFIAALFALSVIGVLTGVVGYLSFGKASPGLFWTVFILMGVGLFCAGIWVAVRLSLAGPITFAEKRVAIFDSWALTRGNFWRILGAYLLSGIFVLLVSMAVMVVLGLLLLIGLVGFSGALHDGASADWSRLSPLVCLLLFVWLASASMLKAMTSVVITAPAMEIYKILSAPAAVGVLWDDSGAYAPEWRPTIWDEQPGGEVY